MINGVKIKQLKIISDERGSVMHMIRCDNKEFTKFGEIYFSTVYPGVVKGWHLHTRMTLNYVVVSGMIKLVLYDLRKNSSTKDKLMEIFIGDNNYSLVSIPPGVWNGFKGLGITPSILANCSDIPYDPKEIIRLDPINNDLIKYDWSIKFK